MGELVTNMLCPVCADNRQHSGTYAYVRSGVVKPEPAPELPERLVETQIVSARPPPTPLPPPRFLIEYVWDGS